ncbi:MAG: SpoIIE family protein phosphatase [Gemmatimonadota bacterium]|jgi:sigma-B regulation protein RsbU (phosphoserine phosphatase)
MTPEVPPLRALPDPVQQTLRDFEKALSITFRLFQVHDSAGDQLVYISPLPDDGGVGGEGTFTDGVTRELNPREGPRLRLELFGCPDQRGEVIGDLVTKLVVRAFEFSQEVRFFTYELSERYEEINLLYSISETLGSILGLEEAARVILGEVCDVLGANRGSLWVFEAENDLLRLVAAVGEDGLTGPLSVSNPRSLTAEVFREGRPLIIGPSGPTVGGQLHAVDTTESRLCVPIRYTPPAGEPRTVGVINLIGQRPGGRFTASDQKLLAAIASQVGSALENHRLIRESLAQERITREMELAHNLQMKLLPVAKHFEGAEVGARVQPAEQVGGDFFHLLHLPKGRIGVMIGDVSTHGFPAALIMALSMSAASIYALERGRPSGVLRQLDDALREELETTEMYLSLFYGIIDPKKGTLTYANAGHPHAFAIHSDGTADRMEATDPPVGIAGPSSYGEKTLPWATGEDLLLLFTDGLSDTLATEVRGSGEAAVLEAAIEGRSGDPGALVDELFRRASVADPTVPADDITALALRV